MVFSRENRRPKTAKTKIYFTFGGCRASRCGSLFGAVVLSTGGRWSGFRGLSSPLVACSLPLPAFLLCLCMIAFEYGSISRFKGVFRGFPLLDVGLYRLRALRGLWGFCVREWLGGLKACGVFCLSFSSLVLLSCFRPALLLGFLPCLLSCSLSFFLGFWCWLGCWLSFPFGRLQT